jgi:DNA (cytosine-5)-methyltransferase 1
MWPEAIRAVREIEPEAFLFENVRGLMREMFALYFASIQADLRAAGRAGYTVVHTMVDAADFGAAQRRHRVIVAGFRRDILSSVELPSATHSRQRLLWEQWVSGSYWIEHGLPSPSDDRIAAADVGIVDRLRREGVEPPGVRWRTVRDALAGLGEPNGRSCHVLQPGARSYKGHTGSDPDQPAKALKAGMHGVPGGENTLRLPDGKVRYLTIREMARLQGLPDEFTFPGSWTESTRQLGNAVPVPLGRAFADWLSTKLAVAKVARAA